MSLESERDSTDPCFPNPCGAHAKCRASGGYPVCWCIYYGNPQTGCMEGECVETHDCSDDRVCKDFHCTDPCPGTCGTGAQCIVRRHVPACTCPAGHTGDPFERCRRLGPEELCDPSPCGRNSKCEVAFHLAICSCLPHFFGNPVQGCRAECESDSACALTRECRQYKCVDPCTDACGENAECRVENHKPICSCPKGFTGHPFDHCRPLNPGLFLSFFFFPRLPWRAIVLECGKAFLRFSPRDRHGASGTGKICSEPCCDGHGPDRIEHL
ncbi:unnamed protein product, partial [Darwinula stevensoni]